MWHSLTRGYVHIWVPPLFFFNNYLYFIFHNKIISSNYFVSYFIIAFLREVLFNCECLLHIFPWVRYIEYFLLLLYDSVCLDWRLYTVLLHMFSYFRATSRSSLSTKKLRISGISNSSWLSIATNEKMSTMIVIEESLKVEANFRLFKNYNSLRTKRRKRKFIVKIRSHLHRGQIIHNNTPKIETNTPKRQESLT